MNRIEWLALVNRDAPMPVARQCRLLDLNRRADFRPSLRQGRGCR